MAQVSEYLLWVEADKCTGCKLCEVACVLEHEGFALTSYARLKIDRNEITGVDKPRVCMHCPDRPCEMACPTGALFLGDDGVIQLNVGDCNGCRMCANVCPYDAIFFDPTEDTIRKCDLCGGDPECVKVCESQALLFVSRKEVEAGGPVKASDKKTFSSDGLRT